jgi:hypothetical protein
MSVKSAAYLKSLYGNTRALGDKAISSDATFEIVGYENLFLLAKQFPQPELSPAGEIEIPMPWGGSMWQPQQLKVNQQGSVTFMETVNGTVENFMKSIVANGGKFDAWVYQGTPDKFSRKHKLLDCFFQADNPDRDMENKSQILMISGTLFFHYFGDTEQGNYDPNSFA